MKRVILESPYAGECPEAQERNLAYAREAVRDSLARGEAPLASQLLYAASGALDDDDPSERNAGMQAGFAWHAVAERCVVYADLGITRGMLAGMRSARKAGLPTDIRLIWRANVCDKS